MKNSVARKFLRVMVVIWLVVLIMRAMPLLLVWGPMELDMVLLLAGFGGVATLSYLAGASAGANGAAAPIMPTDRSMARVTLFLSLVSLLGSLILIFDFSVVRGYGWSTSVNLIRVLEVSGQGASGSALSGIGRVTSPAVFGAWSLYLIFGKQFSRTTKLLTYAAVLAHLVFEVKFSGGRFFLLIIIMQYFFYTRYFGESRRGLSRQAFIRIALAVFMVIFVGNVFITRASDYDMHLIPIFQYALWGHPGEMSDALQNGLRSSFGPMLFVVAYLWLYLTQGLPQFAVILESANFEYAHGFFQFPQGGQILSRLTGIELTYDVAANLENPGTYNTFLGAAYVDFGYLGLFVQTAIIFYFTARSIRLLQAGRITPLSACATLFMSVTILAPSVSVLTSVWLGFVWLLVIFPLFVRRERPVEAGGRVLARAR